MSDYQQPPGVGRKVFAASDDHERIKSEVRRELKRIVAEVYGRPPWWRTVGGWIAATMFAVALIAAAARGAFGADLDRPRPAEPFVAALEVCKPGEPCEVRHLFTHKTTCDTDLPSVANVEPKGTRLACKPVRR